MEILSVINDIVRSTNVSGGLLTHLPFLRYISPGLTGFTALNQRQTRVFQFFQNEVTKHKVKTHGELNNFIDVYLAEINKQSSSTVSYFNGNVF